MAKDMAYALLINAYTQHFHETIAPNKKNKNFLMLKGHEALTHIFNITLAYTNDLQRAIENTQLAINYYTQFIAEIDEYALGANSAVLFVYKKTIYEYI
jgi:hypothetical protein